MQIYESNRKDKRYMAMINNKKYHLGLINGTTYIGHKDKTKRQNYIKRHQVRDNCNEVNPGSLSRFLLWGDSTSLEQNIED